MWNFNAATGIVFRLTKQKFAGGKISAQKRKADPMARIRFAVSVDLLDNAENIQQYEDRDRNSDHPKQYITHLIILARERLCTSTQTRLGRFHGGKKTPTHPGQMRGRRHVVDAKPRGEGRREARVYKLITRMAPVGSLSAV